MGDTPSNTSALVLFRNSQDERGRGTLMELSRTGVVFEVYNPYSIVQLSEVLDGLEIRQGDRVIYRGRAVVSNLVSTGLLAIVSATLMEPWSDLAHVEPGPALRKEVGEFVGEWERRFQSIQSPYRTIVATLRNFFEELHRWLSHGEAAAGLGDRAAPPELVEEFVADVDSRVAPKIDELLDVFEERARAIPPDLEGVHKEYARRELHPLLLVAPFIHRSFTKPLGYAGDYQMINMILGDPWQGRNSYAKIVNAMLLRARATRAHCNRIDRLVHALRDEIQQLLAAGRGPRILDVGCGPAAEIERLIRNDRWADHCAFDLMDFNEETLHHARARIEGAMRESGRSPTVRYIHKSVHQLLKEARLRGPLQLGGYDFVYCAGLFDYLSDRICSKVLRLFSRWVRPGGRVVVTNVHKRNPGRSVMEHLVEWNLIYRNEADMLALCPDAEARWVDTEPTGVNLFLELRRSVEESGRPRGVDHADQAG